MSWWILVFDLIYNRNITAMWRCVVLCSVLCATLSGVVENKTQWSHVIAAFCWFFVDLNGHQRFATQSPSFNL